VGRGGGGGRKGLAVYGCEKREKTHNISGWRFAGQEKKGEAHVVAGIWCLPARLLLPRMNADFSPAHRRGTEESADTSDDKRRVDNILLTVALRADNDLGVLSGLKDPLLECIHIILFGR
jgi:hypothetical protein